MIKQLKPSGHRQRQSQTTRAAVAAAARRVFSLRGYVATTIEAISEEADIPVPTIYSAFGAKPAILEEVRRQWVLDSDVAELHAQAMASSEAGLRLARAAHWTRRQFELGHDVISIYQEAARADKRVAQTWRSALAGREAAIEALLRPLAADLRQGLSVQRAVDLYVALTLPEIYGTLVAKRRWTPRRYEDWLAAALSRELLGA